MQTVTMDEAKAHLPELLEAAAQGQMLLIRRDDNKMVSVTVVECGEPARTLRRIGFMEGQFNVPEDFDTMFSQEILEMFGIEE